LAAVDAQARVIARFQTDAARSREQHFEAFTAGAGSPPT